MNRNIFHQSQANIARERYWLSHLAAQRESGLTQREYCRRSQLSLSTFGWWKRRLRTGATIESSPALIPVTIIDSSGPEESMSRYSGLTIVTRGGYRVEVAEDFRGDTLDRLLHFLGDA